jgi:hypothetical protein
MKNPIYVSKKRKRVLSRISYYAANGFSPTALEFALVGEDLEIVDFAKFSLNMSPRLCMRGAAYAIYLL